MSTVLEVSNLTVRFTQDGRSFEAVKGVSFTVGKGETVALVGESGSGKSVTALSTVSLLPDSAAVSGSIRYLDREMVGASEPELRRVRGNDISFIFQEPMTSLNPLHTIETQLGESLGLHQGLSGDAARAQFLRWLEVTAPSGGVDELALRGKHGFDVRWLDAPALRAQYGIESPGAILSALAARVDPYQLTYRLLMRLAKAGCHCQRRR